MRLLTLSDGLVKKSRRNAPNNNSMQDFDDYRCLWAGWSPSFRSNFLLVQLCCRPKSNSINTWQGPNKLLVSSKCPKIQILSPKPGTRSQSYSAHLRCNKKAFEVHFVISMSGQEILISLKLSKMLESNFDGTPIFCVVKKISNVKRALLRWKGSKTHITCKVIKDVTKELKAIQISNSWQAGEQRSYYYREVSKAKAEPVYLPWTKHFKTKIQR